MNYNTSDDQVLDRKALTEEEILAEEEFLRIPVDQK